MKLLPIRARASESVLGPCELFFINRTKFTLEYFFKYILPFLPGLNKEETDSKIDSSTMDSYTDIAGQIAKYTADINKFKSLRKNAKIYLEIDFRLPGYLNIEDKICFAMPIDNEPELYAKDLFQVYSIPEGELLAIFSFYVREAILLYMKESVANKEALLNSKPQQQEPTVHTNNIESLNQSLLSYESFGKVSFLKEVPEKKRKKKQNIANTPFGAQEPIFEK